MGISVHLDTNHNYLGQKEQQATHSNTFAIGLKASDSAHALGIDLPVIEVMQSEVLGTNVNWTVRKNDKGFFVVDARLKDIRLVGTSSTKTGIDSMVALMSTLSSR